MEELALSADLIAGSNYYVKYFLGPVLGAVEARGLAGAFLANDLVTS